MKCCWKLDVAKWVPCQHKPACVYGVPQEDMMDANLKPTHRCPFFSQADLLQFLFMVVVGGGGVGKSATGDD